MEEIRIRDKHPGSATLIGTYLARQCIHQIERDIEVDTDTRPLLILALAAAHQPEAGVPLDPDHVAQLLQDVRKRARVRMFLAS